MEDYLLVERNEKAIITSQSLSLFHHYKKYTQIMTIKSTKIVAAAIGFTMALGVFAAASVTSAQSMSASDLIKLLVAANVIPADKAAAALAAVGGTATASATTFSKDLTVGSSGADVTALQNALAVSPATGYFGSITKAAVVAYQKAHGISATGYVGPLTRASLNSSTVVSTPSTTTTTTVTTPVINSGVEGTLTADKASVPDSTLREGDTMKAVLGIKLQAKVSDINVQRIKLDLGADTSVYTKVYKTLYVTDDSGKVLVQSDLNSNTVVKDSGEYYLTLGGFSYNVPKDSTKYLWVKADAYSSIKAGTASGCTGTGKTCTIKLSATNPIRGTDGAGIDQYAGSDSIAQSMSVESTLSDSASLTLSTSAVNFKTADVVANDGSNDNQYDKLPVLAFDLRADKDTVSVTDIAVQITNNVAGGATTTRAYLYDGSTLLDTEDVSLTTGKASFTSTDSLVDIAPGVTKTLTVKVDITSADTTATTLSASIASTGAISAENSQGSTVTYTGSASGENFVVRNIGPVFTLVGTPTVSKSTSPLQNNYSTTTMTATFNVQVQAVGGDILFGDNASNTKMFSSANSFAVYQNGAAAPALSSNATSTSFNAPSSGVVVDSANHTFTLQQNNTVTIPVSFTIEARTAAGAAFTTGNYSAQLQKIYWTNSSTGAQTSTFMAGKTEWRTSDVTLP